MAAKTSAAFWDRIAKKYAKKPISNMSAYEKTLERTRHYLAPENQVLEVGCGTGSTALLLAENVEKIIATDISSKMIEIANTKGKEAKCQNVEFHQSTLADDNFPSESFDTVLAFNFLHLLEDPSEAVQKIHGLLKPGGVFISKTVCISQNGSFLRIVIFLMRMLGLAPYVNALTFADLENIIKENGFQIVEADLFASSSPPNRFIAAKKI